MKDFKNWRTKVCALFQPHSYLISSRSTLYLWFPNFLLFSWKLKNLVMFPVFQCFKMHFHKFDRLFLLNKQKCSFSPSFLWIILLLSANLEITYYKTVFSKDYDCSKQFKEKTYKDIGQVEWHTKAWTHSNLVFKMLKS